MVKYEALIHDRKYFEIEHITERQSQYNFTQAVKVETFLWDLELYGQLQYHLGKNIVLKGGTAAQLFFPPQQQRTSVDIDVVYLGDEGLLLNSFKSIHQAFGGDDLYFKFNKYTPVKPKTILPMVTYFVSVPSVSSRKTPLNIKIDFHLMERFDLETTRIETESAFIIPLAFKPLCFSAGSLLGDKLLTLAQGSVGIPIEREDDIVKQLYDIDLLSRIVDVKDTDVVRHAMNVLFERELKARNEQVQFEVALQQIMALLEKYSHLDSPRSERMARDAVHNFRSNYEPRPFRNWINWGVITKRLQFLIKAFIEDPESALEILKEADQIEKLLSLEGNEKRGVIRKELSSVFVEMLKSAGQIEIARRLRNSSPERLFWEVLRPSNLKEVKNQILTNVPPGQTTK
ncbi:MAG: nucleotidyl transferase AbiEii/AbiGii toxin family protein [Bacteroidota bacterium]